MFIGQQGKEEVGMRTSARPMPLTPEPLRCAWYVLLRAHHGKELSAELQSLRRRYGTCYTTREPTKCTVSGMRMQAASLVWDP
jgi:hypothetical protein